MRLLFFFFPTCHQSETHVGGYAPIITISRKVKNGHRFSLFPISPQWSLVNIWGKALIKNYSFYYIDYDDLKHQLKKRLKDNDFEWTNEIWRGPFSCLGKGMDQGDLSRLWRTREINRRVKGGREIRLRSCWGCQDWTTSLRNRISMSWKRSCPTSLPMSTTWPSSLVWTTLGFQKSWRNMTSPPSFLWNQFSSEIERQTIPTRTTTITWLSSCPSCTDLVRTRGNPVKGDSSAGGAQQNFVRQNHKVLGSPR